MANHIVLKGDISKAHSVLHSANKVLNTLVESMAFRDLKQGTRTATLPDGTIISAHKVFNDNVITITAPVKAQDGKVTAKESSISTTYIVDVTWYFHFERSWWMFNPLGVTAQPILPEAMFTIQKAVLNKDNTLAFSNATLDTIWSLMLWKRWIMNPVPYSTDIYSYVATGGHLLAPQHQVAVVLPDGSFINIVKNRVGFFANTNTGYSWNLVDPHTYRPQVITGATSTSSRSVLSPIVSDHNGLNWIQYIWHTSHKEHKYAQSYSDYWVTYGGPMINIAHNGSLSVLSLTGTVVRADESLYPDYITTPIDYGDSVAIITEVKHPGSDNLLYSMLWNANLKLEPEEGYLYNPDDMFLNTAYYTPLGNNVYPGSETRYPLDPARPLIIGVSLYVVAVWYVDENVTDEGTYYGPYLPVSHDPFVCAEAGFAHRAVFIAWDWLIEPAPEGSLENRDQEDGFLNLLIEEYNNEYVPRMFEVDREVLYNDVIPIDYWPKIGDNIDFEVVESYQEYSGGVTVRTDTKVVPYELQLTPLSTVFREKAPDNFKRTFGRMVAPGKCKLVIASGVNNSYHIVFGGGTESNTYESDTQGNAYTERVGNDHTEKVCYCKFNLKGEVISNFEICTDDMDTYVNTLQVIYSDTFDNFMSDKDVDDTYGDADNWAFHTMTNFFGLDSKYEKIPDTVYESELIYKEVRVE